MPADRASPSSPQAQLPVLSVVVVSYHSADALPALWESLRPELALGGSELFLVDNASSDGSWDALRAERLFEVRAYAARVQAVYSSLLPPARTALA